MPITTTVRYVALLLALLGIVLLVWRTASTGSGPGYDTVRLIHILVALGFIGLYEVAMARSKREKALNPQGRQIGMVGRILATTALLIGIFLLLSVALDWVTGSAYSIVVYIHALFGISAVGAAIALFSSRFRASRSG